MASVFRRPALDDRDRSYVPVVLAEMALRAEGAADRDAARSLQRSLRAIAAEETRRWSFDRLLAGLALGGAAVVVGVALFAVAGATFGAVPAVIFVLLMIGVLSAVDRAIATRRIGSAIGATIAAHGFCASCGYSLRGLQPAEDGCLVCPECGGAWRAGRITRPHWSRPLRALAPRPGVPLRTIFVRPPVAQDDRSMLCRRLDSWLLSVPRTRRRAIGAGRLRRLRAEIRRSSLWLRATLAALLVIPLVWLFAHMPPAVTAPESAAMWLGWSLGLLVLAAALVATLAGELGIRTRHLVGACVADSLCASCAADLLGPDAEGFRVCPACGASWSPVYRAEPPGPARADG